MAKHVFERRYGWMITRSYAKPAGLNGIFSRKLYRTILSSSSQHTFNNLYILKSSTWLHGMYALIFGQRPAGQHTGKAGNDFL